MVVPLAPKALESRCRDRHQLGHAGEVPVRVRHLHVAEIRRERGDAPIDVDTVPVPLKKASAWPSRSASEIRRPVHAISPMRAAYVLARSPRGDERRLAPVTSRSISDGEKTYGGVRR